MHTQSPVPPAAPLKRMTRSARWIALLTVTAVFGASAGTGAAVGAGLIGSADVADNSLRSIDVRDETLIGTDVRDGSLSADDFDGPLPAEVFAWTETYTTTGAVVGHNDPPVLISDDTLPARHHIQVVKFHIPNDFSQCGSARIEVRAVAVDDWWGLNAPVLARFDYAENGAYSERTINDMQLRPDGGTRLGVYALCLTPETFVPRSVPSFRISLTFTTTEVAAADATPFD